MEIVLFNIQNMVPSFSQKIGREGFEPSRTFVQGILSPSRTPIGPTDGFTSLKRFLGQGIL